MATQVVHHAPRTEWCWFCRRAVRTDDDESRIVTLPDGSGGVLCGPCIDKADVGPDVPLDMTDDGREGDPAKRIYGQLVDRLWGCDVDANAVLDIVGGRDGD